MAEDQRGLSMKTSPETLEENLIRLLDVRETLRHWPTAELQFREPNRQSGGQGLRAVCPPVPALILSLISQDRVESMQAEGKMDLVLAPGPSSLRNY